MSRVLVTGGTGFLGGSFIDSASKKHEIIAVCRKGKPPVDSRAEWVELDLSNHDGYQDLPDRIDVVVHLAQSRRYREFPAGAQDVFNINIASTFKLLEYARRSGAHSFVYASSGGAAAFDREIDRARADVEDRGLYFASKNIGELLLSCYGGVFRGIILRPYFIYGPGQQAMMIPRLMDQVRRGEVVEILGRPGLRTNPIYVADAVRAVEAALEGDAEGAVDVAGDEIIDLTNLVKVMGQVCGRTPQISYTEHKQPPDLIGNGATMKNILGVSPRTKLKEGLQEMLDKRKD